MRGSRSTTWIHGKYFKEQANVISNYVLNNNGNRNEWSPVLTVIDRPRSRSGSPICDYENRPN